MLSLRFMNLVIVEEVGLENLAIVPSTAAIVAPLVIGLKLTLK